MTKLVPTKHAWSKKDNTPSSQEFSPQKGRPEPAHQEVSAGSCEILFVTDLVRKVLESDTKRSSALTPEMKILITLRYIATGKKCSYVVCHNFLKFYITHNKNLSTVRARSFACVRENILYPLLLYLSFHSRLLEHLLCDWTANMMDC